MGLTATYSVTAVGTALQYQWFENGVLIPGATGSQFVTPALQFSDSGTAYTVTVTNSSGSVTSSPASLTVTARAPAAADLRFQQVDASSTINGYGTNGGESADILGQMGQFFSSSVGTPFFVGLDETGYLGDSYADFPQDIVGDTWTPINGATPASANAVVTSLDLEPASDLFAVGWIQEVNSGGFDVEVNTVPTADLQTAATTEGASSRVITAVSPNTGGITYISVRGPGGHSTGVGSRNSRRQSRGARLHHHCHRQSGR